MSFAKVFTRSVVGLQAPQVFVEVHLSQGLPALTIVGLPEASVRESKDRVRSALINSGYEFPNRRLTINLAPADLPKDGARLDLPIAMGILAASGQIDDKVLADFEFVGELALNGELRPVSGALAIARTIKSARHDDKSRTLIMPSMNACEAVKVGDMTVLAADHLVAVCRHLDVVSGISQNQADILPSATLPDQPQVTQYAYDLADVKGQHHARRALEIAAAGGHSILFTGSPGSGKTLMASRLPSILPPLTEAEALEVASIYSIAGAEYAFGERPFRAIHHTISATALVGGGSKPKPGEISLAHKGAIFLDEIPEFDRKTLETLRQPIESKQITISRANAQVSFPADFQLIAAMNPCPCGYHGDTTNRCRCRPEQIKKYQDKLSGPLLDRIDLHITVPALPIEDLQSAPKGESSDEVRQRVVAARDMAVARQGKANYELTASELDQVAILGQKEQQMLKMAQSKLNLSARSYHRILRVARTIADLAASEHIKTAHVAEALSYR
ncbi:YifB family Mg chelatase-like AAA ATPase [Moraxella catarrhalis]|uniref:MG2+ CHELATASE FAMILY protein n=1 Tax=Moraxella catarrhalis TaxID=480 RepID=A0A198UP27_MORCA|nr:YifB family Mg chelatase-like AAA ATPase [Moraxella catarrhalis]OAU96034.1 MG2+ CHELATASE FAMILY protein [Moraxella catarrhalis]OAU98106.1 MG2+ CHELATASE FAMILY protein [Moraxella catarrhalis]OAV03329.1 MG2+ CHELATASE FAMILY protein [Moraxella catarrhalis]